MTLLALTAMLGGVVAADAPRTNIVVLLCDDLGYGDLGCFGHPRIKTPRIDRLAKEGARLTCLYARGTGLLALEGGPVQRKRPVNTVFREEAAPVMLEAWGLHGTRNSC